MLDGELNGCQNFKKEDRSTFSPSWRSTPRHSCREESMCRGHIRASSGFSGRPFWGLVHSHGDQNPFLFTNVPSTHLWRKTVLKERRGRVFYNLDVQKVLGLWVGAVSTAGDFETVFREIPLLFKEEFPTSLS